MKNRIMKLAEKMIKHTNNGELEEATKIMVDSGEDQSKVFELFTGLLAEEMGNRFTEMGFDYLIIARHRVSGCTSVQHTLDAGELAKIIAVDAHIQSVMREVMQKATEYQIKKHQYTSYTRGEA